MSSSFRRGPFTLSVIAETGERFADFAPYVASIAADGTVAFQATLQGGGSGVFVGSGGAASALAVSGTGSISGICSHPAVNRARSACFYADGEGGRGVFVVAGTDAGHDPEVVLGTETVRVADFAGPLGPTMNDAGTIAFRAEPSGGGGAVFTAFEGSVELIADATDRFSRFHGLPVIDGGGAVTFRADLRRDRAGIYLAEAGRLTAVVETGDRFSDLGSFPIRNDAGSIAFCASLAAGGSGVFVAAGGRIESVLDTSGPFESFRGVLLDGLGRLVFYATPIGGTLGVYTGPDPIAGRLLGMGSPLFGSTVVDFALNPVSINDAGQLAIRVATADERQFILRADPTEG